jgi:hypothetical protein
LKVSSAFVVDDKRRVRLFDVYCVLLQGQDHLQELWKWLAYIDNFRHHSVANLQLWSQGRYIPCLHTGYARPTIQCLTRGTARTFLSMLGGVTRSDKRMLEPHSR